MTVAFHPKSKMKNMIGPHFPHSLCAAQQITAARRERKVVLGFSPQGVPYRLKPQTTLRRRRSSLGKLGELQTRTKLK